MENLKVGDSVVRGGQTLRVVAVVRGGDDPRKCVPTGYRLNLGRDPAQREKVSYLAAAGVVKRLVWIK